MTARIGYTLSSEEHPPQVLIDNARRAEQVGFDFVGISDHFHPWVEQQGQSPFVWSVLGGIAQVTERIEVLVEVVCPIGRLHPAIVAQAAATSAALLEGRFVLGVGTGEYLNEHITGEVWPHIDVRREMLMEAIDIIRELWRGDWVNYMGGYFSVEKAKLYTLPRQLPEIVVSGFGVTSAGMAGMVGDGFVSVAPERELVQAFEEGGGRGKPKYGQVNVCYAETEEEAREIAFRYWPNAGIPGQAASELRLPAYFEQLAKMLTPEAATEHVALGPDPQRHIGAIQAFIDAGYDHVYVHQIGPRQAEFLRFYEREVLPQVKAGAEAEETYAAERELAFRERLDEEQPED
ncbi:MAG: putative F420-dependent oxidoreductase [Patescibacteria group bacterium]|nr:putative F420-dependent oxidoreductase [Patescibacteria group bacterium]